MEVITPIFSQSPDIPSQRTYHLPPQIGTGGLAVERLSSGLQA